jgi:hypothetical protein
VRLGKEIKEGGGFFLTARGDLGEEECGEEDDGGGDRRRRPSYNGGGGGELKWAHGK